VEWTDRKEGRHGNRPTAQNSSQDRLSHRGRQAHGGKLGVREYFLFDPTEDYLEPPLQGHRLVGGQLVPIEPVSGRLPSEILHLHLERDQSELRLYDPVTQSRLLARIEKTHLAEQRALAAEAASQQIFAENQRLRHEDERI